MDKLSFGAKQAIEKCLKVKENEHVLVITDNETAEVGVALKKAVDFVADSDLVILESLGTRPLTNLPDILKDQILNSKVVIFCAQKKMTDRINEAISLRFPIKNLCIENNIRYALMPGVNKKIMEQGMNVDYSLVEKTSNKVHDIVKDAKEIIVKSHLGTDLKVELKNPSWINTYGDLSQVPQKGFNLPSGEVFGYPEKVNGKFVIDGLLGDYFSSKYGLLDSYPVTIIIEDSIIKDVSCTNKELESDFKQYIKTDDNASRIGEVGIGTNEGVTEFVGVLTQDEKYPGLHIACGVPCKGTCDDWTSKVHCDLLIHKANIFVDGKQIMEYGKFII